MSLGAFCSPAALAMRSNSAKDRCGAIAKLGDACLGVASARSYVASWAIRIIETGSCEIKAPCTCQTCHCQTCLSSQDYYALRPVGGQQKPPAPVNPAAAMTHFIPIHRRLRPTREQTKVPSPVNISTAKPKFLPPFPPFMQCCSGVIASCLYSSSWHQH